MSLSPADWPTSLTKKFIKLRLQNDHLFQEKYRSWKTFKSVLIREGFPEDMSLQTITKKWNHIHRDYRISLRKQNVNWKYRSVFEKYSQNSSFMCQFSNWTKEWIRKLLEIRIENDDMFKIDPDNIDQYEENWGIIEKKIKDLGLPVECSVMQIDYIWDTLIKRYNSVKTKQFINDSTEISAFSDLFESYFEKKEERRVADAANEISDSEDDSEPLIKLKNGKLKNFDQNNAGDLDYAVLNPEIQSDEDFKWTHEWTESFIHLKCQNEHLFSKNYKSWNKFYKVMLLNGFPNTITINSVRKKWNGLKQEFEKALLMGNDKWRHFKLMETYQKTNKRDYLENWPEQWVKKFIHSRIKHNSQFTTSSVDCRRRWIVIETELRRAGIPNECILRRLNSMWNFLMKKFRFLHKKKDFITKIDWPYYEDMKKYSDCCNAQIISNEDYKKEEYNNDEIHDYTTDFSEVKIEQPTVVKKELAAVKKEFISYLCRGCLQSSEQVVSLFDSFDNMLLLQKFIECTTVSTSSIENNPDSPRHLCYPCLNQLNISYEFRKKCEQSENKLKSQNVAKVETFNIDEKMEYNFDDSILQTNYSSDDDIQSKNENKKSTTKPSKCKTKQKKTGLRTKNLVIVPTKTDSGEVIYKRKYVYKKICEICGKASTKMAEHMVSHSGEMVHKCEICSKTFRYRASYTTHLKTHNSTPLKVCQLCGKEFYRNLGYKRHLVYHANERKYSCETCGKTFNTKDILRMHIRSHTGERPYSCHICGKSFISKGCVDRHQKVHNKQLAKQT